MVCFRFFLCRLFGLSSLRVCNIVASKLANTIMGASIFIDIILTDYGGKDGEGRGGG